MAENDPEEQQKRVRYTDCLAHHYSSGHVVQYVLTNCPSFPLVFVLFRDYSRCVGEMLQGIAFAPIFGEFCHV
jgi:hypothetical protein